MDKKKRRLGILNNHKIQQMIDYGDLEEPYSIVDIGNYQTTFILKDFFIHSEEEINYKPPIKELRDKDKKLKKNFIASFMRMRQKYKYAIFVDYPLNVFKCINKEQRIFEFEVEKKVHYNRLIFTNYVVDAFSTIELHPEWFDIEILDKCVDSMKGKGISLQEYEILKQCVPIYSFKKCSHSLR